MSKREKNRDIKKEAVSSMIQTGKVKKIIDLFNVLPASHVTEEWGMNGQTMSNRIADPRLFRIGELIDLADYIGVDENIIIKITLDSIRDKKKTNP